VVSRIDRVCGLIRQFQQPTSQPWRPAPSVERLDQRRWPQVLVNVDRHSAARFLNRFMNRFSEAVQKA
jgi:hypothetical protein